jgi:hypothetical protein
MGIICFFLTMVHDDDVSSPPPIKRLSYYHRFPSILLYGNTISTFFFHAAGLGVMLCRIIRVFFILDSDVSLHLCAVVFRNKILGETAGGAIPIFSDIHTGIDSP